MFKSILIICAGNICRSPYAEHQLKKRLPTYKITSAGLVALKSGLQGHCADPMAVSVAREFQVDMAQHMAKQVTQELVDSYDLILCMERNHLEALCELYPTAGHKSFVFGQWIGVSEIEDPYQKSEQWFRQVFEVIDRAAQSWVRKLLQTR